MRSVSSGNDQRRGVEQQQVFRLGPRCGIAVEQGPTHAGHDCAVICDVERCECLREFLVRLDHRCPGSATRICTERLAGLKREFHHCGHTVLAHKCQVLGETLMTAHPVAGTAYRPVENLTQNALRMLCG